MTSFQDLINSFPNTERDEATDIITLLETELQLDNIWQLNNLSTSQIAFEIERYGNDDYFDYLHHRLQTIAGNTWSSIQPGDPSEPTPNEEARINNSWEIFIAEFPVPYRGTIKKLVNSYIGNTYRAELSSFSQIKQIDLYNNFTDDGFFNAYAEFYQYRIRQFIRANSRRYKFTGQLTNSQGEPLTNVKVLAEDNNSGQDLKLGSTITNHEGYFEFKFTTLGEITTAPYDIDVEFPDLGQATDTIEFYFNKPGEVYPIQVSGYPEEVESSDTQDVIDNTSINLPSAVSTYISGSELVKLRNIRKIGGLRNVKDRNFIDAETRKLDALAFMELLNFDYSLNEAIYDSTEFKGVGHISNVSRRKFVKGVSGVSGMDNLIAGRMYTKARAISKTALSNVARSKHGSALGDLKSSTVEDHGSCGCSDCQSAVSPIAYLADLTKYITSNFEDDGTSVDLTFLQDSLHQKFGELSVDCTSLNESVCQSRLAVEVLRSKYDNYMIDTEVDLPGDNTEFQTEETKFRIETYYALLSELGTSFEEIRNIRGADEEDQRDLAKRLGIAFEDSSLSEPNTIEHLYQPVGQGEIPGDFTDGADFEAWLEEVFGFKSTASADPLESVVTSKVIEWKATYLENLWKERDALDNPYHNREKVIIDPDVIGPDDFRNPDESNNPAFQIWVARRTFLDDILNNKFLAENAFSDMVDIMINGSFKRIIDLIPDCHFKG